MSGLLRLQDLHPQLKALIEDKVGSTSLASELSNMTTTINNLDAQNIKKTGAQVMTGSLSVPTINGGTPWTSANDGVGTDLDAGKLAGQLPSYYTDIITRLGYTPLNTTTYTAADVLTKVKTVDGAGSGLDSDLLDGKEGSAYQLVVERATATLPTTGWVATGGGLNSLKYNLNIAGLKSTDVIHFYIDINSQGVASVAEINPTTTEVDGVCTFYANFAPTNAIPVTYDIWRRS